MNNQKNHQFAYQFDGDMTNEQQEKLKNYTLIAYICYISFFFFAFTPIIAVIVAYIKRNDSRGTIYYSHMQYIIKTFWLCLGFVILGLLTLFFIIGILILFATFIWTVYRLIKGVIFLVDNKEIDYYTWF